MTIDMSGHVCTEWCAVDRPDHGGDPAFGAATSTRWR